MLQSVKIDVSIDNLVTLERSQPIEKHQEPKHWRKNNYNIRNRQGFHQ